MLFPISVIKRNPNKIFQYAFMIIMVLIILYMSKIFKQFELSTNVGLTIEILVFLVVFLIIDVLVRKNKDRLFNKIR